MKEKLAGAKVVVAGMLHHGAEVIPVDHEVLGWQESKIITRFRILGLVMALFALTTLKLR